MGPGVSFMSDIVKTPKAPQVLPRGSVMVLGPGPKLGLGLGPHARSKAGSTSSTNHI